VKSGMLVKDDEGVWQVVVDRRGPACLVYANGHEEWGQPDDDVEAVRLTAPQVEALRRAATGNLWRLQRAKDDRWTWKFGGLIHTTIPQGPSTHCVDLGLIEISGTEPRHEFYRLTPSGRALLDLLDKETV